MSIFTKTPVFEASVENEIEFADVYPTVESGMEIAFESFAGISKLTAGLYIADIMTENAIFEGSQTVEDGASVMEASVKEYAKKVKENLIKLKNKIIDWFKKIQTRVFVKFMDAAKFVKQYESEILSKAGKVDFYFNGYEYNESPVDASKDSIAYLKDMVDKVLNLGNEPFNLEKLKKIEELSTSKMNVNLTKKIITEQCRGKEKQKDIKITESMVKKMIEAVKNHSGQVKAMTDFKDDTVKAINDIIADMDKTKDTAAASVVTAKTRMANRAVTTMQSINSHCVGLMNEMYSQYGAILKRVFNTKVAAESAEFEDSGDSLLEAAMALI